MNYFNYYTEIEDTFVRRRGKNLLLSPLDWAMIEVWQERGIPLHVVLRGIETVFDNFDKNPRPRTIKSLIFCKEEVEAQYAEWSAAQVGKTEGDISETKAANGFDRKDIQAYIARTIDQLGNIKGEQYTESIERVISRLTELAQDMSGGPEQIDGALTDIERFLDDSILKQTETKFRKTLEKEIAGQLRQFKAEMSSEAYGATFRLMLLKRLREELEIPRIGLFYL